MSQKILILTAGYGDGHNAAARSVRDAIPLLEPNAKVEYLDLLAHTYGSLDTLLTKGYRGMVRHAPMLWTQVFNMFNNRMIFKQQMKGMGKLRNSMTSVLLDRRPDVIVSTYPVYSHILEQITPRLGANPGRLITVITDSISVCSAWYTTPSDVFVVANEQTAKVMVKAGVAPEKIKDLGFPVNPIFALNEMPLLRKPGVGQPAKVLYVINTGKALAGKEIEQLLGINGLTLTITTGRNAALKSKLEARLRGFGDRVKVLGWTDQMPQLLMSHHLLISKAGGAMVQEAIAARCPIIINQIIPGQEEGNALLIQQMGAGAIATNGETPKLVAEALADGALVWQEWRDNLEKKSRPDSALQLARFVLARCGRDARAVKHSATQTSLPEQKLSVAV